MTETGTNIINFRSTIAGRIKALSNRWAQNTVALGGEFAKARDSFPVKGNISHQHRPGWETWVKDETDWTIGHAAKFIRVYEKFGREGRIVENLSFMVLEYLARKETPEEGITEVLDRAKSGEKIGKTRVKEIVQKHRPSPKAARVQARETGKLVLASDGNLYSGATEDEQAAYSERRSQTYKIRDAIAAIAGVGVTPTQWIAQAEAHWIKDLTPVEIKRAIAWLTKLEARYGHD